MMIAKWISNKKLIQHAIQGSRFATRVQVDWGPAQRRHRPTISQYGAVFMKIFLDSAEIEEIKGFVDTGFVDGVTTNPSLIAGAGRDIKQTIADICALVDGPVSAEVTADDYDTMLAEGRALAMIAPNVAVKVPLTRDGLKTCRALSDAGTAVNVTLCFTAGQALLAAKAGAAFISPFVGRLDDLGKDGMGLIEDICSIYANYDFDTEILVASVRSTQHVVDAALMGADVVTLPPKILTALYKHPLTDNALRRFLMTGRKPGSRFFRSWSAERHLPRRLIPTLWRF